MLDNTIIMTLATVTNMFNVLACLIFYTAFTHAQDCENTAVVILMFTRSNQLQLSNSASNSLSNQLVTVLVIHGLTN